jgi:hypothetical protein
LLKGTDKMRTTSGTRPKSVALAVEVKVPLEGRAFAALASRLTVEGVWVSTFHSLREGTAVKVDLCLPSDAGGSLHVQGQVGPKATSGGAGFWVGFHDVAPEAMARLHVAAGATRHATG